MEGDIEDTPDHFPDLDRQVSWALEAAVSCSLKFLSGQIPNPCVHNGCLLPAAASAHALPLGPWQCHHGPL